MLHSKPIQRVVSTLRGAPCQTVAALLCVCYGIALIMNVELEGDGSWFWYAKLIHQGVRLYADLNFPQQPLFVLETSAWMQLVGQRCIPYEMLAVLHVLTLCGGLLLVLRESRWPDWQKAIILFASFVLTSYSFLYRFDDFHVVNDILVVYSLWLLLLLAREDQDQRQMGLVAALGVLSGLAFTNRLNDGGALLAMVFVCERPLPCGGHPDGSAYRETHRRFLSRLPFECNSACSQRQGWNVHRSAWPHCGGEGQPVEAAAGPEDGGPLDGSPGRCGLCRTEVWEQGRQICSGG